ncbi:MAG TPA: Flp pilus assembly protein CpaB [Pyrinomonadaceae bacterium]|jgi:pilus assembly protein CpaB|nr:Flp pilus assembly protein CpaB [Pyrinomonadaceae bacterium]
MRNKRFLIVMTGALVFGLLAAFSVSRYLSSAQANSNATKVAVAKVDIPLGTKIIPEQVGEVELQSNTIPDGAFESAEKLVGRVAIVNIAAREAITDTKLAPQGTEGGLTALIPEGYRAMTVKVDDAAGVSGFIQPGTLVDVVVVIDPKENSTNQDPISKVVLQNIKVLANAQNIDRPKNEREATTVKAVTLQVTPEQAEKLALASNEGKLQLIMRNSTDQGDTQTTGVNKRSLLSGERASPVPDAGSLKSEQPEIKPAPAPRRMRVMVDPMPAPAISAPAPPPAPRNSIEMIEAGKKRSVDFP